MGSSSSLVQNSSDNLYCFYNLSHSPALLHVVLYTAQVFRDMVLDGSSGPSPVARFHLAQALKHLQDRLGDENLAVSETNLYVVATLAMAAVYVGDILAADVHMTALQQMLHVRGGLGSLKQGTMLEHKAQRCGSTKCAMHNWMRANRDDRLDFALALSLGGRLRFFRNDVPSSPQLATGSSARRYPEFAAIKPQLHPGLLNIWADMRTFAAAANKSATSNGRMTSGLLSKLIETVPPRLLALDFDPTSTAELLRLCMLVILKSILMPSPGFGKLLGFIASRLKTNLLARDDRPSPELGPLLLWALFVTALSVFEDFDREWIRAMIVQTAKTLTKSYRCWADFKTLLSGHIWLDAIFDRPAEQLYDECIGAKHPPQPLGQNLMTSTAIPEVCSQEER